MDEDILRWFHLRHPSGFSDALVTCCQLQYQAWQLRIQAYLSIWDLHHPGTLCPIYIFDLLERSPDTTMLTFPLRGQPGYLGMKLFEDTFPPEFYQSLPHTFLYDLEFGQTVPSWSIHEPRWSRLYTTEQVTHLKQFFSPNPHK